MQVIKRDNKIVSWDREKIEKAVLSAFSSSKEIPEEEAQTIAKNISERAEEAFSKRNTIPIEAIQDFVERSLHKEGYFETMRRYIVYREKRRVAREEKKAWVDSIKSVKEYLSRRDWRVNANANQDFSLGGMILNISGKITANYWLSQIYPPEIGEAHRNGSIHIHDLDMLSGYCCGHSLRTLLREGFNGVPGKVYANPPKHLSSAIGQMVNFLGTLQNEWAGAQAFSSVDTYLAPYVKVDNLSYKEVKQQIQELVYNLNVPSRWGGQVPFTNFTFDLVCPEDLREQHPEIGGKEVDFTYADCHEEMQMINKAYIEVMTEGDAIGQIFSFPIPTYNITKDFDWNSEIADMLFEMTGKYGTPYFQNFLNSDLEPHHVRSMCCRLQLDLTELLSRGNGLFGSAEQTGSVGVVTINCARLGYKHKGNKKELYEELDKLLEYAKISLEIKRKEIQSLIDDDFLPYTKRYVGTLKNFFSTIGVNGINEMIRNFTFDNEDITTEFGQKFASEFLDYIREKSRKFQEETGNLYNLEATPAEGTTYRFAKEDRRRFPGIIQAGTEERPYYTNSSQLPVDYTTDPFEALNLQEELQRKYTGGTVLHLFLPEKVAADSCKRLVKRVLETYRVPYITITPTFSTCPEHGYLAGEHNYCPHDHEKPMKCKVWSRVMGYFRPVDNWNIGKKQEYADRKEYCIKE